MSAARADGAGADREGGRFGAPVTPTGAPGLTLAIGAIAWWWLVAALGLTPIARSPVGRRALYVAGIVGAGGLGLGGLAALSHPPTLIQHVLPLAGLVLSWRLDGLTAFFVVLLGLVAGAVSLSAGAYFERSPPVAPGVTIALYHGFLASMVLVLIANDPWSFLVAWELMTVTSFFLVLSGGQGARDTRPAGALYLLVAQAGALSLLVAFALWHDAGGVTFDRSVNGHVALAAWSLALALIGFGAKAGLLPLHLWLPEAHPVAPSPVSALMSGFMLNLAVYGVLRWSFGLWATPLWGAGLALVGAGLATGVFGGLFASVQTDGKRLLAYTSIAHLGIIFSGLGLVLMFAGVGAPIVAAAALVAVLLLMVAHSLSKSLLFVATGEVIGMTGEHSFDHLGGILSRSPVLGWLALVGALSTAGAPLLAGFAGEWLLLQVWRHTPEIPEAFANLVVPLGAGMGALAVALTTYALVKYYGLTFLGTARPARGLLAGPSRGATLALIVLSVATIAVGLAPGVVARAGATVISRLTAKAVVPPGAGLVTEAGALGPHYAPAALAGVALTLALLAALATRRKRRRVPVWACGVRDRGGHSRESAAGFGQPVRRLFAPVFREWRALPGPQDSHPHYTLTVEDRFWSFFYSPLTRARALIERWVARLEPTRLVYSLLAFFVLLLVGLLVGR